VSLEKTGTAFTTTMMSSADVTSSIIRHEPYLGVIGCERVEAARIRCHTRAIVAFRLEKPACSRQAVTLICATASQEIENLAASPKAPMLLRVAALGSVNSDHREQ